MEILFHSPGMIAASADLHSLYGSLQSLAQDIASTGDVLASCWQGVASDNFHHTLLGLLANMEQFHVFAEALATQYSVNAGTMATVDISLSAQWI